jgi:DHA2 family multidrug resistance protein
MVLLQSLGQSFSLLPAIIILLANSDPTRATALAAYIQVVRLGGAEIGVSLMATWLRIREQIQSNLLGQHVDTGGFDVTHWLAKMTGYFASHGAAGTASARAAATLAELVQRESNILAYIDGFWLTVWLAIAGLAFTACIGVAPPGPFTPKRSSG